MRASARAFLVSSLAVAAACNATTLTTSYNTFTVGGSVTGLNGVLILTNNGNDTLTLSSNGNFTFAKALDSGDTYQVAVVSAPAAQTCSLSAAVASGTITTSAITDLVVTCVDGSTAANWSLSGVVTGLPPGTSLTLMEGNQSIAVDFSDPNFIFPQDLVSGYNYDVRVTAQPAGAICGVTNGVGTVGPQDINNLVVSCTNSLYEMTATVSDLVYNDTLVLQLASGVQVPVTGAGAGVDSALLASGLSYGADYSVAVLTQPTHAGCIVTAPSGIVEGNTQIPVSCVRESLQVEAAVTGLPQNATVQVRNNSEAPVSITGSGSGHDTALLDAAALYGGAYNVTVVSSAPGYSCTPSAGTGVVTGFLPVVVNIACTPAPYVLQAQVSGLETGGQLSLSVNNLGPSVITGGGTLSDNANLSTTVSYNTGYTVAVVGSPNNQTCSITAGATGIGGMTSGVVAVSCVPAYRVWVTVSGLIPAAPLTLVDTWGSSSLTDTLVLSNANNNVATPFAVHLVNGTAYALSVASGPGYQCTFSGTANSSTVAGADVTGILLTCVANPNFAMSQNATYVLGQGSFSLTSANRGLGAPTAQSLNGPAGNPYLAPDGTLFIPDTGNARVLGWSSLPQSSGPMAGFVLGQPGFTTATQAVSPNSFSLPLGIFGINDTVFIGDNARVLIYDAIPHANANASAVLGQNDFFTNVADPNQNLNDCPPTLFQVLGTSTGYVSQGNTLYIADNIDNRALVYNNYLLSPTPDISLGQGNLSNCYYGSGGGTTQNNLAHVTGLSVDDTNRLFLLDGAQNRILVWDDALTLSTYQNADHVMGQTDFVSAGAGLSATAFDYPSGILLANGKLYVSDTHNHRVLIWNTAPGGAGQVYSTPPDVVLGQPDFNSGSCNRNGSAAANTLCNPQGLAIVGTSLLVADTGNNRVLVFQSQ